MISWLEEPCRHERPEELRCGCSWCPDCGECFEECDRPYEKGCGVREVLLPMFENNGPWEEEYDLDEGDDLPF